MLHNVKNDTFVSFPLFCSWAELLKSAFICCQAQEFDDLKKGKKKKWADKH